MLLNLVMSYQALLIAVEIYTCLISKDTYNRFPEIVWTVFVCWTDCAWLFVLTYIGYTIYIGLLSMSIDQNLNAAIVLVYTGGTRLVAVFLANYYWGFYYPIIMVSWLPLVLGIHYYITMYDEREGIRV